MTIREQYREHARRIFLTGIDAITPTRLTRHFIASPEGRTILSQIRETAGNLYLLAVGEAAQEMTGTILDLTGTEKLTDGVIVLPGDVTPERREHCRYVQVDPLRISRQSLVAGDEAIVLADRAGEGDLLLVLLSSGAGAMFESFANGIDLNDFLELEQTLLTSGAHENEQDMIQRQISRLKNGWLSAIAWPANVTSVIIPDAPADSIDSFALGPTAPDRNSPAAALEIIDRLKLKGKIPPTITNQLTRMIPYHKNGISMGNAFLTSRTQNHIICPTNQLLLACHRTATKLRFNVEILSSSLHGESRLTGSLLGRSTVKCASKTDNGQPRCLLAAGAINHSHNGRRTGHEPHSPAHELALNAAIAMAPGPKACLLSAMTNRQTTQNTSSGAYVFDDTIFRARKAGLDIFSFIKQNAPSEFFRKLDDCFSHDPGANSRLILVVSLAGLN